MFHKIVIIILCTMLLVACGGSKNKKPGLEDGAVPLPPDIEDGPNSKKWKQYKKGQPGMIFIDRHTTEYSISMVLDASDDNIYFMMDLPESEGIADMSENGEEKKDKPEEKTSPEDAMPEEAASGGDESATEASKYILYAQTYFFEKKYRRALDEIGRALKAAPDTAVAYSLKGSVHYKLGEEKQAVESWQKALELDPNLDNVKTMLNRVTGKQGGL